MKESIINILSIWRIIIMKKTVALLLAVLVCVVLSACSKENENHDDIASNQEQFSALCQ